MANNNLSLLSSQTRVEVPFVKVQIGDYTFGVYQKTKIVDGFDYGSVGIQFPNYVKSLQVKKINGKVNVYALNLSYAITENTDPNFFDKVFSSVAKTRKMKLSYGDITMPSFLYKDEEVVITKITQQINVKSPIIEYSVSAVSNAFLSTQGSYTFPEEYNQPSYVIERLLRDDYYGLKELFTGMKDINLVNSYNLIPHDDAPVEIDFKENISILEYLAYLVNCMRPRDTTINSLQQGTVYVLNIIDQTNQMNFDDNGVMIFDGSYFKIVRNNQRDDSFDTYNIDIGFPTQNIVTDFNIDQNESYALLYDFQKKLNPTEYVQRVNDLGELEKTYLPTIRVNNDEYRVNEDDKTWWTKVTEYPIRVTLTLKGLLRPALLMNYVRLNTYFFGNKFNAGTGLFIITQQIDDISESGFRTTLSLTRVGGDK